MKVILKTSMQASKASSIVNGVAASGLPTGVSRATGLGDAAAFPGMASGTANVNAIGIPTFVLTNIKTASG